MLAGLRADTTPLREWCDASWAVLAEFLGPGEHIPETWAELTGDDPGSSDAGGGEAKSERPASTNDGDQSLARQVASLSEDDLERWVPAFTNPDISDDEFARGWKRSSKFAAGQAGALKLGGNAERRSKASGPNGGS